MRKWFALAIATMALAACASMFGSPSIHLSRSDLAQRAFVDRERADLRRIFAGFEALATSGPDVGMQTQAQRLQLEWSFRLKDTPAGVPLTVLVALSGRPELNASRTGIDLADARIEHVRVPTLPFVELGSLRISEGEPLGRLPMLAFRPEELNRDGVIFQPTAIAVGVFGVRVALSPK